MTGFWIFLAYLTVAAAVAALLRVQRGTTRLTACLIGLAWLPGVLMYVCRKRS